MEVIKGDTRSLDYRSFAGTCSVEPPETWSGFTGVGSK